ncbi:hypothetical protein BXY53_2238 [Dichotomicrobium thermohalophilum]|uniref:Cytokinin riboside 5'-monophosphate phosphoribohydrolase n=1 Tax=Dichotomicrobium thermohalophilum TaxID=933063 RepID=A0A397PK76_9HYPH|nr:hypothetical protein BXY53_2238 [Dichotomicrobium thermohalophilum]
MSSRSGKPVSSGERLAIDDRDFLRREEMRSHRIALEFERAELGLQDRAIESTIVVFGSARAVAGRAGGDAEPRTEQPPNGIGALLAQSYEVAREFGRIASERGGAFASDSGMHQNVVTTGAGPGIMEAANRGAYEAGAPTIGLNIEIPSEQTPNEYITPGLCFSFHYFAIRKMHFAMRANALVAFPGGFGTLDELFEILTLKQTRKTDGLPVILFCRDYWKRIVDFDALVQFGMIGKEDVELFQFVDSAEEAWQVMLDRGLTIPTPLKEE